jgi:hypothetical protein
MARRFPYSPVERGRRKLYKSVGFKARPGYQVFVDTPSAPDPRDWPEQYGPFVSHSAAEAMRRRLGPGEPSMFTGSHRARMLASGFGGRSRTRGRR